MIVGRKTLIEIGETEGHQINLHSSGAKRALKDRQNNNMTQEDAIGLQAISKVEADLILQQNLELKAERECSICKANEIEIVFTKCGHACTCQCCAQPLLICPMCRCRIVEKLFIEK